MHYKEIDSGTVVCILILILSISVLLCCIYNEHRAIGMSQYDLGYNDGKCNINADMYHYINYQSVLYWNTHLEEYAYKLGYEAGMKDTTLINYAQFKQRLNNSTV